MENTMREDEPQLFIDFMEMQISKQVMHDTRIYYHVKHQYNDSLIASEDQFLFDKSFDWLMPVVEKIEKSGAIVEIFMSLTYGCRIIDVKTSKQFIHDNNGGLPFILPIYQSVLSFIKWYNQQTVTPKE